MESTHVKLRSYQQEMLDTSLQKNIIVAMDTGSGKTHIAIARILAELERSKNGQLVWFMAPSVALSEQQVKVLSVHLPAYSIRTLTGSDGVDKWTDQNIWDAALYGVHVVVGTPAVLADALTHGFVKISRLSLCIFDEAHRATKGHPMNNILQLFYHPALKQGLPIPHILGLTASPVVNTKQGSLETIERNLNALTATPKNTRAELESYVNPPVFITVSYSHGDESCLADTDYPAKSDAMCKALAEAAKCYDFSTDPYIVEMRTRSDSRSQKQLTKVLNQRKTFCSEQLRALDLRAQTLRKQLGPSMARWYISTCIHRFKESITMLGGEGFPDLSEAERKHLACILYSIEDKDVTPSTTSPSGEWVIADKAEQLCRILIQHADDSIRGIIFVEQRVLVTAISHFLKQIPQITRSYRTATFVGTSVSSKRKISVADLVGVKEQQQDLEDFRCGRRNLMIATSVLEEGIDVSACNFVVCFDPPANLVSFVQRRGRARQKDSKYFIFMANEESKARKQDWATLEAQMKKAYMDDHRHLAEDTDDEVALSAKAYRIASTGALLTLENAKSHLYHFCDVGILQVSNYVDLRPIFDTEQQDTKLWTASVDLPSFVHPSLRHAMSAKDWRTEAAAIQDAAFEAYVALHKEGLVNDNLLPLVKDYGPEIGQEHLDQPSMAQVSERISSWRVLWKDHDAEGQGWSSYLISVVRGHESVVEVVMRIPKTSLPLEMMELYWNQTTTYVVRVTPYEIDLDHRGSHHVSLWRSCTRLMLHSVHGRRMSEDACDFPVMFTPTKEIDLQSWVSKMEGNIPAIDFFNGDHEQLEAGLVRSSSQYGRSFFFQDLQTSKAEDASLVQEIVATGFPKRTDFLHRVTTDTARAAAYTGKLLLRMHDCTVDRLPARYALFAALAPSIMHCIDTRLLAQDLQYGLLSKVNISETSLVLEAISSPGSGEATDYNRLEYLGDTVLKYCTELQVVSQHTNWPESYLTHEKDRIVRNSNLAKAALHAGLDSYILTKSFTGSKWRPVCVSEILAEADSNEREMSTKVLADVVEALIGAAFVDGGLEKALKCVATLLPAEIWNLPDHCVGLLIQDLTLTEYKNLSTLEQLVGHKFQHQTLLVEAITHVSFPYNRTGLSYERLEFLGDSVLDMIITPKLFAHPRRLKHWELHRIHEALVNSHFLGFCCMRYAIEEEKFDIAQDLSIKPSARTVHLYDFLRAGVGLLPKRQQAVSEFEQARPAIEAAFESSREHPWPDLVALSPPKFFCDLVESVLGAVFVDSRGDLAACEALVSRLGILDYMRRVLDQHVETISPKERMGAVADREAIQYVNSSGRHDDGRKWFACTVRVGEEDVFGVSGCRSRDEAEVRAAHRAAAILEKRAGPETKRKFEPVVEAELDRGDGMGVDGD